MKKWKYYMDIYGNPLREMLHNEEETIENIINIYKQMILFLKVWKNKMDAKDIKEFEYDIDCLIADMECACPDTIEHDYEAEQSNVNWYLDRFYDICDDGRCWIGI